MVAESTESTTRDVENAIEKQAAQTVQGFFGNKKREWCCMFLLVLTVVFMSEAVVLLPVTVAKIFMEDIPSSTGKTTTIYIDANNMSEGLDSKGTNTYSEDSYNDDDDDLFTDELFTEDIIDEVNEAANDDKNSL